MIEIIWPEVYDFINTLPIGANTRVFGIPRGGAILAGLTKRAISNVEYADFIVDDIIDSGTTAEKYKKYNKKMYFMIDKRKDEYKNKWIKMPWEQDGETDIQDHIIRIIEYIGDDAHRDGLIETPQRMVESWKELFSGYSHKPEEVLKTFENDSEINSMVVVKDIELYSTCEHHFLPFIGKCTVGYIPGGKIVGLSKIARLVEIFARRLQVQERLTEQIADTLYHILECQGVGVCIKAKHLCMASRGVNKQNSQMITTSLKGIFLEKEKVKEEFVQYIR
jgi:GTP cyclohydrolase I